ncbi:MAG: hypothetical protein R3C19_11980 [Planctomycetaceae bacterium]
MTAPTMTPGDNTTPTPPEEPTHDGPVNPLDIGFGIVIEDYGNATSSISYSKREHSVSTNPEYPGYSTYEVGLGSGGSGTLESDFQFVTDDNGLPAVEFDIKMNTSGGTSYGSKAFTSTKYIHPGSRLQKTDTIGYGSTFAAESDFTITVGLFSDVEVEGTHEITSNSQEFNGTRLDYLERMLNDDGEYYLIVFRSVDEVTLVKELAGNLVDGFEYYEYTIENHYQFATTIGEPPTPEKTREQRIAFALDAVQLGLDVAGMVPVIGEAADLINVAIHAARGNTGEAMISMAAMIPFIGGAATAGKLANKAGRAMGKHVDKVDDIGGAVSTVVKKCDGANCFIAGTQVVVGITGTTSPTPIVDLARTEQGTLLPPQNLPAIVPTEDLDAYYAAGALAMAAALSYRRKPSRLRRWAPA